MSTKQKWVKNNKGGYRPAPDHPYEKIKKLLKEEGFKEQVDGEIWMNGNVGTNFYNEETEDVIHLSYIPWPDEEQIETFKEGQNES